MDFDPTEPLFERADVLAVVKGLRTPTLHQWINRGTISLSMPHPGKAANRKFSGLDVIAVAFVQFLSHEVPSVSPSEAAQFVPRVKDAAKPFIRAHPPRIDEAPVLVIHSPGWTREWFEKHERVVEFYKYLETMPKPISATDINKKFGDLELVTRTHPQIALHAEDSERYQKYALFKNHEGQWLFIKIVPAIMPMLPLGYTTVALDFWLTGVINRLLDYVHQGKGEPSDDL